MSIKFEDNSKKILSEAERKKKKILTAIGLKASTIWTKVIKQKKVVDTGKFSRSPKFELDRSDDNTVIVGSETTYGIYLELGTSKMKARPTLKPAILDYKDSYEKLARQIWKE